jgi:hypothetical protein
MQVAEFENASKGGQNLVRAAEFSPVDLARTRTFCGEAASSHSRRGMMTGPYALPSGGASDPFQLPKNENIIKRRGEQLHYGDVLDR